MADFGNKIGSVLPETFEVTDGKYKGQKAHLYNYGDTGKDAYNLYIVGNHNRAIRILDEHVKELEPTREYSR